MSAHRKLISPVKRRRIHEYLSFRAAVETDAGTAAAAHTDESKVRVARDSGIMSGFAPRSLVGSHEFARPTTPCSNPLAFHGNLTTMQRRPANAARQSTSRRAAKAW